MKILTLISTFISDTLRAYAGFPAKIESFMNNVLRKINLRQEQSSPKMLCLFNGRQQLFYSVRGNVPRLSLRHITSNYRNSACVICSPNTLTNRPLRRVYDWSDRVTTMTWRNPACPASQHHGLSGSQHYGLSGSQRRRCPVVQIRRTCDCP